MNAPVSCEVLIKIYINGLLHLSINRNELLGIQSWLKGTKRRMYYIEFTMRTREILSNYDSRATWAEILKLLDQVIQ